MLGLGWLIFSSSCTIPIAQPLPFTNDYFGDFHLMEPSMECPDPFYSPNAYCTPRLHRRAARQLRESRRGRRLPFWLG